MLNVIDELTHVALAMVTTGARPATPARASSRTCRLCGAPATWANLRRPEAGTSPSASAWMRQASAVNTN